MKIQNVFRRYEQKYLLTHDEYVDTLKYIEPHVNGDEFGKTNIMNLYYDSPSSILIRNSIEKPKYKEKLRLRVYGEPTENSNSFVELKKKYNSVVYKRRLVVPLGKAQAWLSNCEIEMPDDQITKEINYFMAFYGDIQPHMFIGYRREAFYEKENRDFRITFDRDLIYRSEDLDLTHGFYGERILDEGLVLMEIKTAGAIPLDLSDYLCEKEIYKTSFSKYGKAYEKYVNEHEGVLA